MSKQSKGLRFQEKIAKMFGGESKRIGPDVLTDKLVIECKVRGSRGEKQIVLKKEWFDELLQQATKHKKLPLLVFKFKGDKRFWVVLDGKLFYDVARVAGLLEELPQIRSEDV